jgi:hypothetical protein
MKRTIYTGVKWGVDPVEDGAQINLFDEAGGEFVHIPFTGESLRDLIGRLAPHLSQEHRSQIAPLFNGGVYLPGRDFDPDSVLRPPGDGPQG